MAKSKRKRKKRRDSLVLQLVVLVAAVLIIFEGKLVVTMISHRATMKESVTADAPAKTESKTMKRSDTADGTETESEQLQNVQVNIKAGKGHDTVLAGLPFAEGTAAAAEPDPLPQHETVTHPDSQAIVREASAPVDDSYFSDAVFIGDSRMQGFQNASGITQGTFFTSVGMSLSAMQSKPIIQTPEGNLTVAAALSGGKYNKIYLMLGANDLGEYDWDAFREGFISCTRRFREIQPDAVFYICSVIYVEESKVTTGSYVNNTNVDKINGILLDICEQEGYYYLDLNEILSNGYGSLIEGASSDGVHIYEKYCRQMLDYMKSHYVTGEPSGNEGETEAESKTEAPDEE